MVSFCILESFRAPRPNLWPRGFQGRPRRGELVSFDHDRQISGPPMRSRTTGQYRRPQRLKEQGRSSRSRRSSLPGREGESMAATLGLDISKDTLDACLLSNETETSKKVPNNAKGFGQLKRWLKNRRATDVHVCIEATGSYFEEVAESFADDG